MDSYDPNIHTMAAGPRLRALAPMWPIPSGDPSPIPSASPLRLGLNSLPESILSPPVFGWPSVDPSIVPSALPSSLEMKCNSLPRADRAPMVAPDGNCLSIASRSIPGPSVGLRSDPVPSTEPSNIWPRSTGVTMLPWDCHRDRPWDRPSEGPKVEPSG
jgi:hypothetical protein